MTDTLQELQKIDDGDFEKLVVFFLRTSNPKLTGLKATGINEEGRAIACPVDAIVYLPGNPPYCFALAATVYKVKGGLRQKWLGGKNKTGDIEKAAIEEFQKWRQDEPNVVCILFLATNQFLKKDTDLYREAINQEKLYNIEINIIEASELIDFLDYNPLGQYVRAKILHIKAEQLSESLLRDISETSLSEHQRIFGKEEVQEIVRDAHTQVLNLIGKTSTPLIGLRGASGTGKSTLLRQVGITLNAGGDIALWIPHEIVQSSTSITDLLHRVLKRFYPTLDENAGADTIHIISSLSCKLVLLIDDINRSSNPLQLLSILESIAKSIGASSIKFVIPLWLGQLAASPKEYGKKDIFWEDIKLDLYSSSEKRELTKNYADNDSEPVNRLIEALNGDPFLCGIALDSGKEFLNFSSANLIAEIFDYFLQDVARTTREIAPTESTSNEYLLAIDDSIKFILEEDNPEPEWEKLGKALGNKKELLRQIAVINQIGWIDQKEGLDFWRWKHDKIRDALLGRWLANKILPQILQENITEENQVWLSNPGLAEAWAFSLIFLKKSNMRKLAISILAKHQPLAFTELLHLNLLQSDDNLCQLIAEHLQEILMGAESKIGNFARVVQPLIIEKLAQIDNFVVLKVTESLERNDNIWATRFRNGDISSALEWINYEMLKGWFLPEMNYPLFEQALEKFSSIYNFSRTEVAKKIVESMECSETSVAAITLAGYLTWSELAEPAWNVWYSLSGTEKLIATVPTIWALSRCGDSSMQSKLEETLLFTNQLRQADDELCEGDRAGYIPKGIDFFWRIKCQNFEHTLRWPITSLAAETWVKVISENSEFHKWKWEWLRSIDHAIAVEAYVQYVAAKTTDAQHIIIQMIWRNELSEGFHDPIKQIGSPKNAYNNSATCNRLWKIVESNSNQLARLMAFLLWKRGATVNHLGQLQKISADDEIFEHILKVRLKLRDRTAASFLVERMHSEPRYWSAYVPFLQEMAEVFEAFITNLDAALKTSNYRLNSVAKYLSVERVRELVKRKRDLLMKSPQAWLALWYSDVPEALKLVQEAMIQSNPNKWHRFLFPDESFQDPISQRMLDALIPVLKKHPAIRDYVAEKAVYGGFEEWVYEQLPDVAMNSRIRYFIPVEADINRALAVALKKLSDGKELIQLDSELHIIRTVFRRRDRFDSVLNIQAVLKAWLNSTKDKERLILIAMLLAAWGDSRDITWWQEIQPVEPSSYATWVNTLYILKRRRWHGVNEYTAMS